MHFWKLFNVKVIVLYIPLLKEKSLLIEVSMQNDFKTKHRNNHHLVYRGFKLLINVVENLWV